MRTRLIFTCVLLAFSSCLARPALAWTHADNVAYVTALYTDLAHRNATSQEIGAFATALDSGVPRSYIARKFMTSSQVWHSEINSIYVRYVSRSATPLEWGGSTALQQTSSLVLSSPEYYKLKGGTSASFVKGLYLDVLGRLPQPGDEVLIQFEHGDVQRPYVVGAVFNSQEARRRLDDGYCRLYLLAPCGSSVPGLSGLSLDDAIVAILSSGAYGMLHRGSNLQIPIQTRIRVPTPSPSPVPVPRRGLR